jgi:pimeloyl-ACP methyl ester carboxylesterase
MKPRVFWILLSLVILAGCEPRSGLELHQIQRADGSSIAWYLDRRGHAGDQGILVLAQGSGCSSPVHGTAMLSAAELAPDHAVVMLEKRGVPPGFERGEGECPETFHQHHTISGWAEDLEAVIESLKGSGWWNGELVLFGGSEGGAMVTLGAARLPQTRALVVLSSGLGMTMAESLSQVVPPEAQEYIKPQLEKIRANPESSRVFSEHSHRWWSEVLDRDFLDDLLALDIPILLIQGGRDDSVPVASGRKVSQAFDQAGRTNLTYREYPALDHGMVDGDGHSQLEMVISDAGAWLAVSLADH